MFNVRYTFVSAHLYNNYSDTIGCTKPILPLIESTIDAQVISATLACF